MSRFSTRPSQSAQDPRFRRASSFVVVALLLLSLVALPLAAQPSPGGTTPGSATPPVKAPSVEGFVTSVDGTVLTLLGSTLLRIDIAGATIISADSAADTATPPPIGPGAFVVAIVQLPDILPPFAFGFPPPLKATSVVVRPAGTAVLDGEVQGVGSTSFSLLFRTILVDEHTVFSGYGAGGPVHGLSDLKPGMQATAWVVVTSGGLLATKVEAFGPFIVPTPVSFRGIVKVIGADSWTIGDMTVGITADTKIVGDPKVGDLVDVIAQIVGPPNPMMGMPSRLVAISITKASTLPPPVPGRTFSFTGPVQAIPPNPYDGVWKIGGKDVVANGLTKINGAIVVGDVVEVKGHVEIGMPATAATVMMPFSMKYVAESITKK